MKNSLKRREFIRHGSHACIACAAFLATPDILSGICLREEDLPELTDLCYCGYQCPDDCKLLKATMENVPDLKKEAYEEWQIKELYHIDFDPEKIFCYKCKNPDKPEGIILTNCSVRRCAIEKELECCISCKELPGCDKDLWSRFPEFHRKVIEMQKAYLEKG